MDPLIYNTNTFLEIRNNYNIKDTELDSFFNTIFNIKKKKNLF